MSTNFIRFLVVFALFALGGLVLQKSARHRLSTVNETSQSMKEIRLSGGVKHSIPLNEIISGGPPKDGIPSIDRPNFIVQSEADTWLKDDEPGVALDFQQHSRFYPFQILVWHEIVNDTIGKQRVLITYCPLCLTGIVFDPVINGERVEFGTSGKLWNSNLLMYDRKTDSLWSQVLGEAVVGEMTGAKLAILPSDIMKYGVWKRQHSSGEVLSRPTGTARTYGRDPYGDYYTTAGTYFPLTHKDARLEDKAFVLGIVINGQAKAYAADSVKKAKLVEDTFEGTSVVAEYQTDIDAVRLFEKKADGSLERLNAVGAFWFSWAAAHPQTALYK